MKKLLLFLFIFSAFTASAQIYQAQNGYGFQYRRLKTDSTLHIPTFCGVPTLRGSVVGNQAAIAVDSCNHKLYFYDPKDSSWSIVSGGAISSSGVDSVTYSSNQLCQWIDGVSTCYRLNKFFDSTSYNYDSTKTIFYNNGIARDSIIGRTKINLPWPLYWKDADSSINFRNDSLPILKYAPGVDTSGTDAMDIPVKKWVLDRLSGGITQSQLNDTAAAIRAYSYPLVGNPSGFLTSSSITGKLNISDTASMLSPYLRSAIAASQYATITNLNLKADKATTITINGTTQDLSTNRSWTISGGGSATDKQDSMNVYMPEKYGAVGDGVTDDAAAFRAMIAAMPAQGGKVHLMSKTYLIGSTVTVNKSIMIEGSGEYATILKSGTDNIVLLRIAQDRVSFRDFKILSTQSSPTAGCAIRLDSNLTTLSGINGYYFNNVYFDGFYNQIESIGAAGGAIQKCRFIDPAHYGIWVANIHGADAGDTYITGCEFMPKNDNSIAAIYQTSSGGLRIINNKFNMHWPGYHFKYHYLGVVSSTVDLLVTGNSFESFSVSAIRLTGVANSFENISIAGNQFASYTAGARPDIYIDSCSNISIQGNVFDKTSNDTAVLLTKVSATNVDNAYKGYSTPVIYTGSNSNLRGDGVGSVNQIMKIGSNGLPAPTTSMFNDSLAIPMIKTLSSANTVPAGSITDGTGAGQLTIVSNMDSTFGSKELDFVNSNTAGGGFSFYQITSTGKTNLLKMKSNGYLGLGGNLQPNAYLDVPASSNSTFNGQIHLGRGQARAADGYLSYDTAIAVVPHLYFSIGTTRYQLDQQAVRWVARVGSTTSSATPTINTDNYDIYKVTAQAANITSFSMSGTPVDGDILEVQITATGSYTLAWGTPFASSSVTLPTAISPVTLTVIFQYFTTSSYGNNKWICTNYF